MERLLEREAELEALTGVVAEAGSGRGGLVLVGGEAGVGKTSLLRELRARLDPAVAYLEGACEPLSVPVPLAPLRELAAEAGAGELSELALDDRLALARALLAALAARAPALAVVEDAHWADPATLDVVRLLARRVGAAGVALVVTYRDDELAANPALALLVGDLATAATVRRLAPARLSSAAVRALAAPAGLDAAELERVTAGNPFLVVEAVANRGGVPATVRDATLARVTRLAPPARSVVEAAAIVGLRVAPDLLAAVVDAGPAAVEETLARGVLTDADGLLAFRHELTRQAIEDAIAPPRRAELHGRVHAALAARGDADHARLAHHAERAGLSAEAGRHAERAAAAAEAVGALREASLQLDRALRLGAARSSAERHELLLRHARATNFGGDMREARAAAEEAVALAERGLGARARGRALTVLAWARWSLDDVVGARDAAAEAVRALAPTDAVIDRAHAQAALLRVEAIDFDPSAVIAAAPAALALADAAGLGDVRIDLEISLALARGHRGEPGVRELLAGARAAAIERGLTFPTIRADVNGVALAADSRDHATVDAVAAAADTRLDDFQVAVPRVNIAISTARSLLDRGRWDEAAAVAAGARTPWQGDSPLGLAVEGLVAARRGEDAAPALLERAWAEGRREPEGERQGLLRAALAEAAWLRGDLAAGRAQAEAWRATPYGDQLARPAGDLALWGWRCGAPPVDVPRAAEPVARELAGDWRGAIRAWRALDAPYEAALASLGGDDRAAREAVAALRRLGADAAARAFARAREERGARAPRGPRRSTLGNAAGLTRREQEVLTAIAAGATNAAVAATLHLSERTVAHHVSAILGKLGAPNRTAAVDTARRLGALAQDGPPAEPT